MKTCTHRVRGVALTAACVLAAHWVPESVANPLGGEIPVNTTTDNHQREPDVAVDGSGNFIVVFQNHLPVTNANVSAQRFAANGTRVGNQFLVNTTSSSDVTLPAVAMNASGAFVVAWQDFGDDGSGQGIFARRYNAAGVAQGANSPVNTTTEGGQHRADVAIAPNGTYVIVWENVGDTDEQRSIRGRRYNAAGAAQGAEFAISTDAEIDHTYPRITMDGAGNFVVGWAAGNVGANQDVVFRRFAANGTALSTVQQVNVGSKMVHASGVLNNMSLDADTAGNFFVAWDAVDLASASLGVLGRRYNSAGTPLGAAFVVSSADINGAPEVFASAGGQVAVAFEAADTSLFGAFVQRYGPTGQRIGLPFQLNTTTTLAQDRPTVALMDNGTGVAAWRATNAQDGEGDGVYARRFQNPTPLQVTTLAAALLPSSRSVQVGSPATAFATVINTHADPAIDCFIAPQDTGLGTFTFQTTNPATNVLTGTANARVDIAGGNGSQSFLVSLTPGAPLLSEDVAFVFDCTNTQPAPVHVGLNTLLLSASTTPVPDIVALAVTPTSNGIVDLAGANGANAFAVATVNVGAAGSITATPDTGAASLPLILFICPTNAAGNCITPPNTGVTVNIGANATPTFAVFVNGSGQVPFDPANNRVFVRFTDGGGVTRGATSVAVQTVN